MQSLITPSTHQVLQGETFLLYQVLCRLIQSSGPKPHKIIVVIDSSNDSAALDFIDDLKALDLPMILIGQPTCVDRIYMEVRSISIPSKRGFLYFPIKAYHNHPRGDRQEYSPNYVVDLTSQLPLEEAIIPLLGLQ